MGRDGRGGEGGEKGRKGRAEVDDFVGRAVPEN